MIRRVLLVLLLGCPWCSITEEPPPSQDQDLLTLSR